ncbi:hypothetical protein LTR35_000223 [Friedmanniomyces endolithicus]|uniref:RlpA-like protein double-psi beta-barrel domain-containing protein n=1 Tax=Friedmanniomyces endolithicus TaxID=329885 RepID=A0AAN6FUH4_9PEZI|nr:hypothetical protein LTS00_011061 [Friedmanniomyces endolithicus]KAK0293619.1 hypothetical protein LTR35_000223 [Friedmanniomyces endolithicus]KAK0324135.1 hypothetical protein LTR82_004571 [Friedmanniomyces endolithicus]KAK0992925.1 hypothetical protein LTR54_011245 [Friedmanniomyces endolithicus]
MASTEPAHTIPRKEIQIPEWDDAAVNKETDAKDGNAQSARAPARVGLSSKLDSILPPHRRYLGLSRKVFLIALLAAILALLALVIGLAAGLSARSKHNQDLPLPSNAQTFTGDLTYYGTGLGACGETSGDSDDIVSISHIVFDAAGSSSSQGGNSNNNPLCNQMLRASRYDADVGAERSVDLKVVDRCTGCSPDDLDTSLGAFEKLAPSASGRVDVTWAWLQPVSTSS